MDFVQITKPTDWLEREDINVIATEALVELSGARGDLFHSQTPGDIVAAARQASNAVFFTCDQVQFLLLELTKAIVIKERYSPKVGTLKILQRWTNKASALFFIRWRMGIVRSSPPTSPAIAFQLKFKCVMCALLYSWCLERADPGDEADPCAARGRRAHH